jgi:hypothetical protein
MTEFDYRFSSLRQQRWFEFYLADMQQWNWVEILSNVERHGAHLLGSSSSLRPAGEKPTGRLTDAEREQRHAWQLALLRAVLHERGLGIARRSDPDTGESLILICWPAPLDS